MLTPEHKSIWVYLCVIMWPAMLKHLHAYEHDVLEDMWICACMCVRWSTDVHTPSLRNPVPLCRTFIRIIASLLDLFSLIFGQIGFQFWLIAPKSIVAWCRLKWRCCYVCSCVLISYVHRSRVVIAKPYVFVYFISRSSDFCLFIINHMRIAFPLAYSEIMLNMLALILNSQIKYFID